MELDLDIDSGEIERATILVVDDSPDNLTLMSGLLRKDYRVKLANSGEKALKIAQSESPPDLILLDIMMPVMDGYEVCRQLMANPATCRIPVIFLTAKVTVEAEQRGFDLGAIDYITKPISPPIVESRVRTHLQNKRARDFLHDQNALLESEVAKRTLEVLAAAKMKVQFAGLQQELEIARQMQLSILPRALPKHPNVAIAATMIAAKEVGGDFYDYFFLDERTLGVAVADVSGKGVPAAFFMAITRTLLRATARFLRAPGACIARLNEQLASENEQMMFVTVFYGVLDLPSGEFVYVNAGHNPPLRKRSNGQVEILPMTEGIALAVVDELDFNEARMQLAPGDLLLLYSDGVTEAHDPDNELFGDDRLTATLGNSMQPIVTADFPDQVVAAVRQFARGAPQSDDITCMAIEYFGR